MAELELNEGVELLQSRAKNAEYVIYTVIGFAIILLLSDLTELLGVIGLNAAELDTLSMLFGLGVLGFLVVYIASVVLISMWIYRAHANLHAAGYELEFTPGWAVGWYFVPIANLFKPFQVMKEQWAATFGAENSFAGEAPDTIRIWWFSLIASGILRNVSTRLETASGFEGTGFSVALILAMVSTVLTIVSAWKLLELIREITAGHRNGLGVTETFA